MIALIQRVARASVVVNDQPVANIGKGLLALIGIEKTDSDDSTRLLAKKLLTYRVFSDQHDKMNLDVVEAAGELILVPQFTLAADTQKGRRPGFSRAAPPHQAEALFDRLVMAVDDLGVRPQTGIFGADMQVSLTNDGPVTFWLQI